MKLAEIKPLVEWRKIGKLAQLTPEQIHDLRPHAKPTRFSLDQDWIITLLDSGNQLIYFVIDKLNDKVIAYSVFEEVIDGYFKQENVWTDQNFRKRGIQVNLLAYILHDKSIIICNGDGLTDDNESFWLKFKDLEKSGQNYSDFSCFAFDFEEKKQIPIKELNENQLPEKDRYNRYRYCVSLTRQVEEKWLVGPLYQNSKFKVLKEAKLRAWLDFVPRGLEDQID